MATSRASLCFLLLALAALCSAESLVPLLAWSNSDSLSDVPTSGFKVHDFLSKVKTNDISVAVVLKSNKLSFDDIAKYGGVYGEKNAPLATLQISLSSSTSSLSTGVSGQPASDLITYLTFSMDTQPVYVTDVKNFPKFEEGRQYVVVVELPEGDGEDTFREHDDIMTKAMSSLSESNLPYAVFYTSDRSTSPAHNRPLTSPFVRRSASPEGFSASNGDNSKLCFNVIDSTGNQNCTTCLLFCIHTEMEYQNKVKVGNETMTIKAIANNTNAFKYKEGGCNTSNYTQYDLFEPDTRIFYISLDVDFTEVVINNTRPQMFTKTIVFAFAEGMCKEDDSGTNQTECGFWTMNLLAFNSTDTPNPTNTDVYQQFHADQKVFSRMAVPLTKDPRSRLSYACGGNNTLNMFVPTENTTNDQYQLLGIQVQPFADIPPSTTQSQVFHFGTAYQCQGYFGAVSWMGIVSVLILILIMYISVVFVFSIQSIDRFDDARGETIKVENLH